MAFSDLGLNEQEFFSLPPFRTYLMQMHQVRKIERAWEQTREVVAMIHNTTQGIKRSIMPQQIIKLSFDKNTTLPTWTKEEADELIRKWSN